tara:strand:+ start:228 stop:572 length:345 start_codon:yes stop_codon:yes gene_type:complete
MQNKSINEDKLATIVIDFSDVRGDRLTESWLSMFGGWVEHILKAMFGGNQIPVTVRGTRQEIDSFSRVLSKEKRYIEAFKEYGLDNPNTYKSKYALDRAVSQFERKTGIPWPFV